MRQQRRFRATATLLTALQTSGAESRGCRRAESPLGLVHTPPVRSVTAVVVGALPREITRDERVNQLWEADMLPRCLGLKRREHAGLSGKGDSVARGEVAGRAPRSSSLLRCFVVHPVRAPYT